MNFVLDNSVAARWFFDDGNSSDLAYADKVLAAIKRQTAAVPGIWGLEAANVLVRAEANGFLSQARTKESLELINDLDIVVDDETLSRSLSDTLDLARRFKLTAYDASYLELALRLDIPLATLDYKLIKAARKAGVERFA
ncbi:MAG: type II toxin-antitoxin system VapC family toxin [Pyrinomonadaceae bacterium]